MTELIKLLHEEIDRLEIALTAERQRADGLQAQLADERQHVAELYERLTPATTLRLPMIEIDWTAESQRLSSGQL